MNMHQNKQHRKFWSLAGSLKSEKKLSEKHFDKLRIQFSKEWPDSPMCYTHLHM